MIQVPSPRVRGILWALVWVVVFSCSMAISKKVSLEVPQTTIIFMRLFFGTLFFLPVMLPQRKKIFKTQQLPLHLFRIGLVYLAMWSTYYAYRHLPLAFATTLGFSGPLIETLLAILILREVVRPAQWIALVVGYLGVFLMVMPINAQTDPAIFASLFANLTAGLGFILARHLLRQDSVMTLLFFLNVVGMPLSGILWVATGAFIPEGMDLFYLILMGGVGAFSQFASGSALRHLQASFLAPFEYLRLVVTVPLGFFLFQEIPDLMDFAGAAVIILSTFVLVRKGKAT